MSEQQEDPSSNPIRAPIIVAAHEIFPPEMFCRYMQFTNWRCYVILFQIDVVGLLQFNSEMSK